MTNQLVSILRQMRADCMTSEAEAIRDWPEGEDRTYNAMRHLREARLQNVLGNLTEQEQYRIYSILSFAMPNDGWPDDHSSPPHVDAEAPADLQHMSPPELMCQIGCEACEGGRMREG
jgi:hypothetical protein